MTPLSFNTGDAACATCSRTAHSNRSRWFFLALLFASCWLSPAASQAQQTILVFGDSLSAGYGLPRDAGWVNLLQQELQQEHPQYRVVNASISGETTSGGRQRIGQALHEHVPAVVIVELGANDGLRGTPLDVTKTNLSYIIRQCVAAHTRVLLIGMRLPPNYGEPYTSQFHQLYASLAKRYHIVLLPFMLEGIAADQFQADNLHPTAAAQPQILRNVMQRLKPLLNHGKG